jgi:hypothetical protein
MDNKAKMYRCERDKIFNNNRSVYASYEDNKNNVIYNSNDIRKKINNIINSDSFIYRTRVNIVIDNQVLSKKIAFIHDNNLVTIDNEYIPIELIQDIYK